MNEQYTDTVRAAIAAGAARFRQEFPGLDDISPDTASECAEALVYNELELVAEARDAVEDIALWDRGVFRLETSGRIIPVAIGGRATFAALARLGLACRQTLQG